VKLSDTYQHLFDSLTSTEIFETMSLMTKSGFFDFIISDYVLEMQNTTVVLAAARKLHEFANFADDLDLEQRLKFEEMSKDIFKRAFVNSRQDQKEDMEKGWKSSQDLAERFGYRSGAIHETLAPHRIFSDD
jgi:hypothetical protein